MWNVKINVFFCCTAFALLYSPSAQGGYLCCSSTPSIYGIPAFSEVPVKERCSQDARLFSAPCLNRLSCFPGQSTNPNTTPWHYLIRRQPQAFNLTFLTHGRRHIPSLRRHPGWSSSRHPGGSRPGIHGRHLWLREVPHIRLKTLSSARTTFVLGKLRSGLVASAHRFLGSVRRASLLECLIWKHNQASKTTCRTMSVLCLPRAPTTVQPLSDRPCQEDPERTQTLGASSI